VILHQQSCALQPLNADIARHQAPARTTFVRACNAAGLFAKAYFIVLLGHADNLGFLIETPDNTRRHCTGADDASNIERTVAASSVGRKGL
jgi:hypothetical protein